MINVLNGLAKHFKLSLKFHDFQIPALITPEKACFAMSFQINLNCGIKMHKNPGINVYLNPIASPVNNNKKKL
jgi:hypothetical protein